MEEKMIKLAIVGSRTFNDYELLKNEILRYFNPEDIDCIVSGGARGADAIGEQFADEFQIPKVIYKAEWDKYGKRAGFIRNEYIIKDCTHCIAFWDGESHGTKHGIELCQEMNKPYKVINF